MIHSKEYQCKKYNVNDMTCYRHIYSSKEHQKRCPIRKYEMFPKYNELPCNYGIIEIDWILYIKLKGILSKEFIEL